MSESDCLLYVYYITDEKRNTLFKYLLPGIFSSGKITTWWNIAWLYIDAITNCVNYYKLYEHQSIKNDPSKKRMLAMINCECKQDWKKSTKEQIFYQKIKIRSIWSLRRLEKQSKA